MWVDGGHDRSASLAIAEQMADRAPFDLIFALMRTRRVSDLFGPLAPLVRKRTRFASGHPHHDPRNIAMLAQDRVGPRESIQAFTLDQAIESAREGSVQVARTC